MKQNIFFTSDTHYSHKNICRELSSWTNLESTRDFKDLDQMNIHIVNSLNKFIRPNDILYHLGDWSFGGFENIEIFRRQIMCQNIHLILGNHDHYIQNNRDNIRNIFSSVEKHDELIIDGQRIVLNHFPLCTWHKIGDGAIHLHGHCHSDKTKKLHFGKSMDVGVDGNDFKPYSLQEIKKIMSKQPIATTSIEPDYHI